MSMPPSSATVRATVRAMSSGLKTSHTTAIALPPRSTMVRAVPATFASVRPAATTAAPAAASASAIPCPTPWPAPVTSATLPSRLPIGLRSCARRGLHPRQPVRRELRGLHERLDLLVQPLVHRLADAPLAAALHVLVAVQRAAGGADFLGEVDEHVGQIPDPGRRGVGQHVDLRVVPGVTGHRVGIECTGDGFEDLLASAHLPAVAAADIVDLDVLGEHVAHAGNVAGIEAAPVAVLQALDEFDVFQA